MFVRLGDATAQLCVVTWPGFRPEDPEVNRLLVAAGVEVEFQPKVGARTPGEVAEMMKRATAAVVSTDPFDETVFASTPRLRVIARTGVGLDSIDLDAATRAGVVVTRTDGAHEETVADHTLALMLAAVRRVLVNDASVRRGDWDRAGALTPWSLHGKCVGLIGLGRIGTAVARRLEGFGCEVLAHDPHVSASDVATLVPLEALLARADVVSLHAPVTPETRHLLDAARIGSMRPGAILINASRGELVDEAALTEALAAGTLGAAALDVFEHEPPRTERLLELSDVVLSPHIAGFTSDSIRELTLQALSSALDVLAGRPAEGIVNPEALEHARHGVPARS